MEIVATVEHAPSEQIICALTKYRRFEIAIGPVGNEFYSEIMYPRSDGETILNKIQRTSAIDALAEALGFIEKVLESDRVYEDETYIGQIYLEGKSQYISLEDMSSLREDEIINCLVRKL